MDFRMPSLGADMDAGSVAEWRVRPGDVVHRGDIVAVVQTDKADIEVEVFADGTVDELLVDEGERVAVGTPLARLSAGAAEVVAERPSEVAAPAPPPAAAPAATGTTPPAAAVPARRGAPRSAPGAPRTWSPLVRHLAESSHLNLGTIAGSGPGGVIQRRDVEAALVRPPRRASPRARRLATEADIDLAAIVIDAGSGPGGALTGDDIARLVAATTPPQDRRESQRRAVGELMARSKREIPHYYLASDVDLSAALELLAARNADRPPARRVLPAALLLRAVALAATEVPGFNGHHDPERGFAPAEQVHLGVAVSRREGGLVAPALHDVAGRDLDDLMAALRDLVRRARSGRLRGRELAEATLTVTNLGDRGAREVYGVIVPPQVAIVGFGRVAARPWVVDGEVLARPLVTVTLSADHRVTSGHEGSRFLDALATYLQRPEEL